MVSWSMDPSTRTCTRCKRRLPLKDELCQRCHKAAQPVTSVMESESTECYLISEEMKFLTESRPCRKIGGSSMTEREASPMLVRWRSPRKIVVLYDHGAPRVAEDVVEMRQAKRDLIFIRRYPGGREIACPYKREHIVTIEVRTPNTNPERNYALQPGR